MTEPRTQTNPVAPATFDLAGKTVGRFSVRARLGGGGMGEVYLAHDTGLKRQVALKRIAPTMRADAKSRQRLWKEAELASRLNDPHIAAVYDVVEDGDEVFVVMEYVEGETLRRRLTRSLKVAEFLSISTQCAAALAVAHQAGLLHRDIKPENIMLTGSGQVKALDFGVAREMPGSDCANTRETFESARFSGTLAYMSPEILDEKPADARADIFSLGVVFYEALTGHNPFRRAGFLETCNAISHEDPPPLRERNSQIPKELERIVAKMLAKNPEERYVTAADLRVDLEAVRRSLEQPIALRTAKVRYKKLLKGRLPLAILAAAVLVAIAVSGTLIYEHSHSPVLNEHDSILLGEFENQTDQRIFDATVTEAVRQSLEQSHYVHLVSRSQVAEAEHRMGRTEIAPVDVNLGREICQRENFRALLIGRVTTSGSRYRVTAQIVDPWRAETILTEEAPFKSPSGLYPAVDDLTRDLRAHLGESLKQVQEHAQPLERVTTNSLEALQRYSRALDFYAGGDMEAFIPLAKSATDLDPDFAMAHLYLALTYDQLGNNREARAHIELAQKGLSLVTERERYLILATHYRSQRLYEKAAENYRLLTDLYPNDLEAFQGLASASYDAGRVEDAISSEKMALRINPDSARDHVGLMLNLNRLNRFEEALADYESAKSRSVKHPRLHWVVGLAYLGKGDTTSARREFQLLREEGGPHDESLAALCLARVLMYEGRLHEAAEALRAGLVLDEKLHSEGWVPVRRYLLAEIQRTRGRVVEAQAEARLLANAAQTDGDPWELRRAGILELELGDTRTSQGLLSRLADLRDTQGAFTQACFENLKGSLELAAGRIGAAVESQRRASAFFSFFAPYMSLGEAYTAQRDWINAIEAYRRYLERKGEVFTDDSPSDWVLAYLSRARVFAHAGDTQNALSSYDEFLRIWADADPDLPDLRQARAEREKLIVAPSVRSLKTKEGLSTP
jgi:serine/threonine protein kinase/tetratricopeptide (TPR) repeat protein